MLLGCNPPVVPFPPNYVDSPPLPSPLYYRPSSSHPTGQCLVQANLAQEGAEDTAQVKALLGSN